MESKTNEVMVSGSHHAKLNHETFICDIDVNTRALLDTIYLFYMCIQSLGRENLTEKGTNIIKIGNKRSHL